jgi:hypothetical protein
MRIEFLAAWLLILGSYTAATGQMGVPATSFRPHGKAGSFSSTEQSEKDESHQALARARRTLLTATKVLVVREPFSYSSSKAERAFRKALVKWERFQRVHEAETAELIIVISDYSSSRAKWVERIRENVAIFAAGSTPDVDARPLWAVTRNSPRYKILRQGASTFLSEPLI